MRQDKQQKIKKYPLQSIINKEDLEEQDDNNKVMLT